MKPKYIREIRKGKAGWRWSLITTKKVAGEYKMVGNSAGDGYKNSKDMEKVWNNITVAILNGEIETVFVEED